MPQMKLKEQVPFHIIMFDVIRSMFDVGGSLVDGNIRGWLHARFG